MSAPTSSLRSLVRAELIEPVAPEVADMAAAIAARFGEAARAVLFYGSCLRERELTGLMLDFYVIVSSYREAYGRGWLAVANRLLPPNVFPFEHAGLIAKYAVMSEADFREACGPGADNISVWARFAQPARLAWTKGETAQERVVDSVAMAAPTLIAYAKPMLVGNEAAEPLAIWKRGFSLTYGCELRSERPGRSDEIVDKDPERYARVSKAALGDGLPFVAPDGPENWRRFRRRGKILSVLRIAKAATTFSGGIDYLVWKINRHAGSRIELKPWQRRWPLLGAFTLLPRLLRQGAIR